MGFWENELLEFGFIFSKIWEDFERRMKMISEESKNLPIFIGKKKLPLKLKKIYNFFLLQTVKWPFAKRWKRWWTAAALQAAVVL